MSPLTMGVQGLTGNTSPLFHSTKTATGNYCLKAFTDLEITTLYSLRFYSRKTVMAFFEFVLSTGLAKMR